MDITDPCPCGHPWEKHTTPTVPESTVPTCLVFNCSCDMPPPPPRLRVGDLVKGQWLRCTAQYEARHLPTKNDFRVTAGTQWQVLSPEGDHVVLQSTGDTIAVPDRDLYLFFEPF